MHDKRAIQFKFDSNQFLWIFSCNNLESALQFKYLSIILIGVQTISHLSGTYVHINYWSPFNPLKKESALCM